MMNIKEYFERRAIKKYLTHLSPELKKNYGGSGPYTYGQVKTTIKSLNLGFKYADFAYFVYCHEEEYKEFGFHLKEIKKYRGYQDRHFDGTCGGGGSSHGGGEGSCGASD